MCGIAGFCDFTFSSDLKVLRTMTDSMTYRGPDDSGYRLIKNNFAHVGLGHRRLSILDLSQKGHQPMQFENLVIIYNGEVYNFKKVRKNLQELGYQFFSTSDTEVVLKAFHCWVRWSQKI